MPDRPYHHGNLRAELLTAAGQVLREQGAEQISLRELARRTGVTHNAPHRHFRDRQALLGALAAAGFDRLGTDIAAAISGAGDAFDKQLRAAAAAFVRFAVENAALLDLMFALGKSDDLPQVRTAADRVYAALGDLLQRGLDGANLRPDDPTRRTLLIIATFQGIASLASTHRTTPQQTDELLDDATALFTNRR